MLALLFLNILSIIVVEFQLKFLHIAPLKQDRNN